MNVGNFSNSHRICFALISAAILFAPASLCAQVDPMAAPADSSQQNRTQNRQQQQPTDPRTATSVDTTTQDSMGATGVAGQAMKDKNFLRKAAEGGMAEVQLGQLAATKASADDVKAFAQKMVTDHGMLNEQMKPVADSAGVKLPNKLAKPDQEELEKLNGLSGTAFDTEYLTYMVKDHHSDIREFRMEGMATTDPNIKAAVEKGLQVIREHTRMVDQLAKDRGIPVPTRGGPPPTPAPAP